MERGVTSARDEGVCQALNALATHTPMVLEQYADFGIATRSADRADGRDRWLWRLRYPSFRRSLPSRISLRGILHPLRQSRQQSPFPRSPHVHLRRVRFPQRQHGRHQRVGRDDLYEQPPRPYRQTPRQDGVPRLQRCYFQSPDNPSGQAHVDSGLQPEHQRGCPAARLL